MIRDVTMHKLLVANRGEIAIRIFRTCRELGIATVAVVAPDDAGSLHARSADETVGIVSYLDPAEHVRAAQETGADAIHPGYGFLAESPDFAAAVESAGLVFVGPSADALRRGGDKLAAKEIARSVGVPVVEQGDPAEIGFPLVIKAAAGGGGRGMRVVRDPAELDESLAAAQREAKAAFGDERVFCERYVERPRHVEIQLLADGHGNVVSLGERECSVQRRHQKVLEESPSVAVHPALRARMSEAAVAFARAIGYRSAGTAEFMVDGDDFWFLELNGRIQVEHPVTELVTGLDLVAEQLVIASGGQVTLCYKVEGSAVEVRLYAEDPRIVPAAGRADRAVAAADDDPRRRGRRGRRRDRPRLRPDDREAHLARADARGSARPAGGRAARDGGRGRDDEPPLPALARRASEPARRRDDDRVPCRAPAALGAAGSCARASVARPVPAQPPVSPARAAAGCGCRAECPRAGRRRERGDGADARHGDPGARRRGRRPSPPGSRCSSSRR